MKNNYSIKYCFDNIKEFIFFMKKRAKELDFPIISESVKTIKKYHLKILFRQYKRIYFFYEKKSKRIRFPIN